MVSRMFLLGLATIGFATIILAAPQAAGLTVVFVGGGQLQASEYAIDLVRLEYGLTLGQDQTIRVPISSVRRIVAADGQTVVDPDLLAVRANSGHDLGWVAVDGWSEVEIWDAWEGDPKWAYRWSTQERSVFLVPLTHGESAASLELRLLPIAYAIRATSAEKEASQSITVSVDGSAGQELELDPTDWSRLTVPLPATYRDRTFVKVEITTTTTAVPARFSGGILPDRRRLGIALAGVTPAVGSLEH